MVSKSTFIRPFPPLTEAQRYYLEVNGYVVVENALSPDEVEQLKNALYGLSEKLEDLDTVHDTFPEGDAKAYFEFDKSELSISIAVIVLIPPTVSLKSRPPTPMA